MTDDRTRRIAELNDLCRKAMGVAGRALQTQGISALPPEEQSAIREKVESFDAFSEDNNPTASEISAVSRMRAKPSSGRSIITIQP